MMMAYYISIGWCRSQNNILSYSVSVVFTPSAIYFLFLHHGIILLNFYRSRSVILTTVVDGGATLLRPISGSAGRVAAGRVTAVCSLQFVLLSLC